MSRDLTTAAANAAADAVVRPALFVEGQFTSGYLRLWTGVGPITWQDQVWTGAGQLLTMSIIGETSDLRAVGLRVSLAGMPNNLALVLAQARRRYMVKVWLAFFEADDDMIASPFLSFQGLLDVPDVDDSGETSTITISYESELIDLERSRVRRYTHEDQQLRAPGDRFFEYTASLQSKVVQW